MAGPLDPRWAPFVDRPQTAGIFTDFDGTLSSIVEDPEAARPLDGVPEVLVALAGRYARVVVCSGRPVDFLAAHFDPSVLLVGLYGLETIEDGVRLDHPSGGAWREAVDDVAATGRSALPEGVLVEAKGLSLTLHYRRRPEAAEQVAAFADRQAARSGLVTRPAKMSVELHPPIDVDKGTVVRERAAGLDAVCFIGDDEGDVAAFDALDDLAATGVHTVRVAVAGADASATLLARADEVLDGPRGVLSLLRSLAL